MATDTSVPDRDPDETPVELGALRVSTRPGFDARISAIMASAEPQLEALRTARAAADSAVVDLPALSRLRSWRRPVLAFAGFATAAGLALLLLSGGPSPTATGTSFASSAGVPAPLAAWAEQGTAPTTTDIVKFLETP